MARHTPLTFVLNTRSYPLSLPGAPWRLGPVSSLPSWWSRRRSVASASRRGFAYLSSRGARGAILARRDNSLVWRWARQSFTWWRRPRAFGDALVFLVAGLHQVDLAGGAGLVALARTPATSGCRSVRDHAAASRRSHALFCSASRSTGTTTAPRRRPTSDRVLAARPSRALAATACPTIGLCARTLTRWCVAVGPRTGAPRGASPAHKLTAAPLTRRPPLRRALRPVARPIVPCSRTGVYVASESSSYRCCTSIASSVIATVAPRHRLPPSTWRLPHSCSGITYLAVRCAASSSTCTSSSTSSAARSSPSRSTTSSRRSRLDLA